MFNKKDKEKINTDVVGREASGSGWLYSNEVKEHFFNPKNFLAENPEEGDFNAEGEVGNMACGDIMKMWIKVNPETKQIEDLKWRTWGCASAIAATSVFSEMVLEKGGMKLEDALKISSRDILERLHGLPPRKVHCSVLADQAFKKAVENYRKG
jgi:nitrogen fixation NifU-like protein/NifU-like protein